MDLFGRDCVVTPQYVFIVPRDKKICKMILGKHDLFKHCELSGKNLVHFKNKYLNKTRHFTASLFIVSKVTCGDNTGYFTTVDMADEKEPLFTGVSKLKSKVILDKLKTFGQDTKFHVVNFKDKKELPSIS
jgi:hypothetical protein